MQTKIVVITAITNGYDRLREPPVHWMDHADFICFSDEPLKSTGWRIEPCCTISSDPVRNAKLHKIVPVEIFNRYSSSMWIDGSVEIKALDRPGVLFEKLLADREIAAFKHRTRNCIYLEAEACLTARKDNPDRIRAQVAKYRAEGFPEKVGLNECSVLVRRHNERVVHFCQCWHREVMENSRRDQLSFNFIAWKTGLLIATIPGTIIDNEYFTWYYHENSKLKGKLVV